VKYIGVAVGDDEGVLKAAVEQMLLLQQHEQQQEEQQDQGVRNGAQAIKVKSNLHVTLWHTNHHQQQQQGQQLNKQPQQQQSQQQQGNAEVSLGALPTELLSCSGSEVVLQVVALDKNDHVLAAQVDLLDGPPAVVEAWQGLAHPHITLWVAPGHTASEAMDLGQQVQAGAAERKVLQQPLELKGVVKAFQ